MMKITIKIYQQPEADFEIDAEASETVASFKAKIYESQGHDVEEQILIFCARALVDDRTLESYGITEKNFLALMISKPHPRFPPPPPELAPYFDERGEPIFSLAAVDAMPPISVLVPESSIKYVPTSSSELDPVATSTPDAATTSAPVATSESTFKYRPLSSSAWVSTIASTPDAATTSAPVTTSESTFKYRPLSSSARVPAIAFTPDAATTSAPVTTYESTFKYRPLSSSARVPTIASTLDAATTASFVTTSESTFRYRPMSSNTPILATAFTPDAVTTSAPVTTSESTFKYIPMSSSAWAPVIASTSDTATTSTPVTTSKSTFKYVPMSSSAQVPATTSARVPASTATSQQQQGGALGGVSGAGSGGLGDFAALRNDPRVAQFRELVTQNPQLRQLFIQRIAEDNPELGLLLAQNPDVLLQILGSVGEDGGTGPSAPPVGLDVTEAEREAIERLEVLGFPKQAVIEAYFACDKNEELAANYLFDNA